MAQYASTGVTLYLMVVRSHNHFWIWW